MNKSSCPPNDDSYYYHDDLGDTSWIDYLFLNDGDCDDDRNNTVDDGGEKHLNEDDAEGVSYENVSDYVNADAIEDVTRAPQGDKRAKKGGWGKRMTRTCVKRLQCLFPDAEKDILQAEVLANAGDFSSPDMLVDALFAEYSSLRKRKSRDVEDDDDILITKVRGPKGKGISAKKPRTGSSLSSCKYRARGAISFPPCEVAPSSTPPPCTSATAMKSLCSDDEEKFECKCCFNDQSFDNLVQCFEGHLFCKECLRRYAESAIGGQGSATLRCMTGECGRGFPRSQLEASLPAKTLQLLDEREQEESVRLAVKDRRDLAQCPHCNFKCFMAPEDSDKVLRCQKPDCGRVTCRLCKEPWDDDHFGLRCCEVEKLDGAKLRKAAEEKMTAQRLRNCQSCQTPLIKEGGCNKLSCRCGAALCNVCRTPLVRYEDKDGYHFCQHPLDPGKACQQCNKCNLWSDPECADDAAIEEIRQDAELERAQKGFSGARPIGVKSNRKPPVNLLNNQNLFQQIFVQRRNHAHGGRQAQLGQQAGQPHALQPAHMPYLQAVLPIPLPYVPQPQPLQQLAPPPPRPAFRLPVPPARYRLQAFPAHQPQECPAHQPQPCAAHRPQAWPAPQQLVPPAHQHPAPPACQQPAPPVRQQAVTPVPPQPVPPAHQQPLLPARQHGARPAPPQQLHLARQQRVCPAHQQLVCPAPKAQHMIQDAQPQQPRAGALLPQQQEIFFQPRANPPPQPHPQYLYTDRNGVPVYGPRADPDANANRDAMEAHARRNPMAALHPRHGALNLQQNQDQV